MNVSEILKLRLINQQIYDTSFHRPHDLVAWLGAVQAQDYVSAQWSIGLRSPQSTSSDIEQAINDKTIVRMWTLRGTLHFVAVEDIQWMLKLTAPRAWGERHLQNLVRWNEAKKGGHFPALEVPQLLADDIRGFAQDIRR